MASETLTLARSMRRFAVSRRKRIAALSLVRAAGIALVFGFALAYFDVLMQLNGDARLALVCGAGVLTLAGAAFTYYRYTRAASEARLVARLVELDDPSLHNDLINALEFEQVLADETPVAVSRPLMQHEVDIASVRSAKLERVKTLTPPSLRKELYSLLGGLLVSVLLVLLFSDAIAAVLPRYIDPYGDHPPYSPTRLTVNPAGITVDYGENVTISATASGVTPEEVTLVLEVSNGQTVAELPMLRSSEGDYRQTIERATQDLTYHARIERGRSKRYALSIGKTPRIGAVNVSYAHPAYTKLPPQTRQLGADAIIRAYEGTDVELTIASNRPLRGGAMRLGDSDVEMTPGGDAQTATGSFTVGTPVMLEARITDVENNVSNDILRARIEVLPDTKPRIAIVSPGRQAFAIPTAEVPIEIETQDDLGVANITLFRGLNGSGDLSKTLFASEGGETQVNSVEVLDLPDLGLRPGDVIDFYATVADTYPKGPQTEATPSHQITIISEEQYRSFLQQETTAEGLRDQYYEVNKRLEDLIAAQEEIEAQTQALLNTLESGAQLGPEDKQKLLRLSEQQQKLAQETQDAAKSLRDEAASPSTFDIEKDFKKSLGQMAERLDRARNAMDKSATQLNQAAVGSEGGLSEGLAGAQKDQQTALGELGQNKQQFAEQIGKPLDEVGKMYKLLEDVETFKAIYAAQVDLERQARSYRDVNAPSLDQLVRLKELGQAQNEIRNATIDLRNNFEKHAAEIEPTLPNIARDAREIAEGIDGRNIPTVMEQAMNGLASGDGANGHHDAEEAARLMDQMIERVAAASGGGSEMAQSLRITMGMNPGDTMSQMQNSVRSAFQPGQQPGAGSGGTQTSNAFDMFGPQGNQKKADKESRMSRRRMPASAEEARDESEFAGAFEELDTDESHGPMIDAPASQPITEEYRPIIEAYFQRLAEEKS
ncbi:MAG: hypothetical protein HUU46_10665 [Candidatus Hydrogenedentes bacterium]|nr:hypothetical protein [Candidatus Hydrogenedentota bacterium]